jgi:hypothetical protein
MLPAIFPHYYGIIFTATNEIKHGTARVQANNSDKKTAHCRFSSLWCQWNESTTLRGGADKSLAFLIFLFAAQPKEFFLDGFKKLEQ